MHVSLLNPDKSNEFPTIDNTVDYSPCILPLIDENLSICIKPRCYKLCIIHYEP